MFRDQSVFVLFAVIPIAFSVLGVSHYYRRRLIRRIGDNVRLSMLSIEMSIRLRRLKSLLWIMTVCSIILALAKPVWGIADNVIDTEGISIMVVLDISTSMNARDILPSRLERAKLGIRNLYEGGEGNQLGLILFAGTAFVQFPLTTDVNSAITFLNAASSSAISQQGTALEVALRLAVDSLDKRIALHSVIVLMTDGENHQGDPLLAAEQAAALGIPIHTIGYGGEDGVPIPEYRADGQLAGYKADAAGNVVLSKLDEMVLEEIAVVTGGTFQRASDSGIEIINLLNEVNDIERGIIERRFEQRQVERFSLFVLLAVITLLIEMLLPERKLSTI